MCRCGQPILTEISSPSTLWNGILIAQHIHSKDSNWYYQQLTSALYGCYLLRYVNNHQLICKLQQQVNYLVGEIVQHIQHNGNTKSEREIHLQNRQKKNNQTQHTQFNPRCKCVSASRLAAVIVKSQLEVENESNQITQFHILFASKMANYHIRQQAVSNMFRWITNNTDSINSGDPK